MAARNVFNIFYFCFFARPLIRSLRRGNANGSRPLLVDDAAFPLFLPCVFLRSRVRRVGAARWCAGRVTVARQWQVPRWERPRAGECGAESADWRDLHGCCVGGRATDGGWTRGWGRACGGSLRCAGRCQPRCGETAVAEHGVARRECILLCDGWGEDVPHPEDTSFSLPGFQHCGTACTCRGGGVAILVCEGPRVEAGPALPPGSSWRRRPSVQRQE
ncbi:hypothetical protein TcCL_ESM11698 [Trypanosoma cruzi]|nr:hypothetical protein TcCL_ESM11698 [Trypanosoma cruzi]